jgi:hypothetical protein
MEKIKVVLLAILLMLFSLGMAGATDYDATAGGSWSTEFVAGSSLFGGTADTWHVSQLGTYSVGITDCCLYGDYFEVKAGGSIIGTTPIVAKNGSGGFSQGTYVVGLLAGSHIDFIDVLLRDYYLGTGPVGFGGTVTEDYSPAGATVTISRVPEPVTLLLLGLGLVGLAGLRRKE